MNGSKLYVGNLSYDTTTDDIKQAFAAHGEVTDAIVMDRKGFGFVTMATPEQAEKAKEALNETEMQGRKIKVDEAKPPKEKRDGGGGGGFRGNRRF